MRCVIGAWAVYLWLATRMSGGFSLAAADPLVLRWENTQPRVPSHLVLVRCPRPPLSHAHTLATSVRSPILSPGFATAGVPHSQRAHQPLLYIHSAVETSVIALLTHHGPGQSPVRQVRSPCCGSHTPSSYRVCPSPPLCPPLPLTQSGCVKRRVSAAASPRAPPNFLCTHVDTAIAHVE